jgi:hypothetical protein
MLVCCEEPIGGKCTPKCVPSGGPPCGICGP